jgi:RNA polymerase sigma-70 factor (ECF subfamily)
VLHNALEKLPPAMRSVILLRDYEGYSYKEIGTITGLSEAQVKINIFRGRAAMRNYLVKTSVWQ